VSPRARGAPLLFLFTLERCEQGIEILEAALPELAIVREPSSGFGEGPGFETGGAALGVATARNQAGALEDFEVFGDSGLAHGEGSGQLEDGGFSPSEAGEDGAARRVSEGREGGVEGPGGIQSITIRLHNL